MPKVSKKGDDTPKNLKPYIFHGVDLTWSDGSENALGDCPFCGREGKFGVLISTGQWRCLVCATGNEKGGGNVAVFLRCLHEASEPMEVSDKYPEFMENRKLLFGGTLTEWGVRQSAITGDVLVPGYGVDGKLNQLYKYVDVDGSGKRKLLATPECNHQLFYPDKNDVERADTVIVCEGPWDAMALHEVMAVTKMGDDGMTQTGNLASSLLSDTAVIAVPGCNVFNEAWGKLLAGKRVVLMFDSDHPRENPPGSGKTFRAGLDGMKRVSGILSRVEQQPSVVECLYWGPEGYDPSLPTGHDVRDWLSSDGDDVKARIARLETLLSQVGPIPEDWVSGRSKGAAKKGSVELECLPCRTWAELITSCRKAMKWIDGLDRAMACMLATSVSTLADGDQLWFKIIGPASCGKSTLCEALSVCKKYVYANSTMTGIHSGWKTDAGGEEDHSLVTKIKGKTLIIKDGDTLLQSASKDKTLSELRDIYDRVSRVHYGNGISRAYEGIDMTLLLCGTSSLRALDSSELGERFLDCVIMEGIDDDLEDEILRRKFNQVRRNISIESNGERASTSPEMTNMMQLTGGYVQYLRQNAQELLSGVDISDEMGERLMAYGKFVSYVRARPSTKQDETAERELAARLVSQLTRLAYCLCVVLNKTSMDADVERRVRQVALDTARGDTLSIVTHLREAGAKGMVTKTLMVKTHQTEAKARDLLRFLRRIKAVDYPEFKQPGLASTHRWVLTENFARLFDLVITDDKGV